MSNIQQVIVRLLTDDLFRRKVQLGGEAVIQEYCLTAEESAIIAQLDLEQWANRPKISERDRSGGVKRR